MELFMLSQEAVKEFQNIYQQKFGQNISLIEAQAKGLALLRLYRAVLKPSTNKGSIDESTGNTSTITQ